MIFCNFYQILTYITTNRGIIMEALGVLGFIFGSGAMFFGLVAWSQISVLRKEFEELKNSLEKSGNN